MASEPTVSSITESLLRLTQRFNAIDELPPPSKLESVVVKASYHAGYASGWCWTWLRLAAFNFKEGFDDGCNT
jgi:hypothetical protein